ncbi:uncharacterized protein [Hemitrygon akajei]|uniref:uncharacterized protein isoform X1 n=2 Tax=Hemitrygon akajei TaxID=2704970 RepID=UPI003BFA1593
MASGTVFYCELCDVHCTSDMNLKMHFMGMKHRRREEGLKNLKINVPTMDAQHSFGSSVLEKYFRDADIKDPIIGLNYVIEYQTEGTSNPFFFCELCDCRGGVVSFITHILGFKHKLNYMTKTHPAALQFEGAKLKKLELHSIIKEKAGYIEKIDGSGKVKVVLGEMPSEISEGNPATKRVSDTYDQLDSSYSHRENFRNNFGQNMNFADSDFYESRIARSQDERFDAKFSPRRNRGDMEISYDTRMLCSQDGQFESRFSRNEYFGSNFGQHLNRGSSSSYESRMPYSQDFRSSGDILQDNWRKAEMLDMDWSSNNIPDSGDVYRRREPMRDFENDYIKGSGADERWMQREFEAHEPVTSKTAFASEELFECLQNFQIFSDSDAKFVLKVTQSLTDALMEYRRKTMNTIDQDRRPPMDEELRRPIVKPNEYFGYEPYAPAHDTCQTYTGNSTNFRTKYKVGGTWKKTAGLHSKPNVKKIGFQSNRKLFKPTSNTGSTKSKNNVILTPHLLKAIDGMDIERATKTLTKLSKTNPALKGLKIPFLVDVLVEAGVLTRQRS